MSTFIRKYTSAFGNMFNSIQLFRYNPDGSEAERFLVPIQYAGKEKYVARLQGDPELDKKVQITLPSMSFEMTSLNYDSARKQITNFKSFYNESNGSVVSTYNPVPYDMDFELYIYVRNEEDGHQIIEYILPFFTPDYTLKLNLIPELGEIREVPIILKNVNVQRDYEGSFDTSTRMIIWTLSFNVKGFIFGVPTTPKLITRAITSILDSSASNATNISVNVGNGFGSYQEGEIVYQGYSLDTASATASVVSWESSTNTLILKNINGNFVVGTATLGSNSNANYTFGYYEVLPQKLFQSIITPNPSNATANSNYTYTVTQSEYPNIT